jgi:hypothetical protein
MSVLLRRGLTGRHRLSPSCDGLSMTSRGHNLFRLKIFGAGKEDRTPDLNLGKVALYHSATPAKCLKVQRRPYVVAQPGCSSANTHVHIRIFKANYYHCSTAQTFSTYQISFGPVLTLFKSCLKNSSNAGLTPKLDQSWPEKSPRGFTFGYQRSRSSITLS